MKLERSRTGDLHAFTGYGEGYVLVNGEVTIEDDKETHRHTGQLLRHGRGRAVQARAA